MAVAVTFLFNPEKSKTELAAYLTRHLQQKVLISKVDLKMLPPALHVGGVTILRANDTPLFQADSVDAPFAWRPLLKGRLAPRELTLSRWTLSMKRAANGSWEWQEGNRSASNLVSSTGWSLDRITLEHGQVNAVDPWGPGEGLQWREIRGALQPGTRRIQLQGDLSGFGPACVMILDAQGQKGGFSGEWGATLHLRDGAKECAIQVKSSGKSLTLHGESAAWNWESVLAFARFATRRAGNSKGTTSPLQIEQWKADLTTNGSSSQFSHTGLLGGGATEAKGTAQGRANDLQVTTTLAFKDVPAEAVPNLSGLAGSLTGKVTGMASFVLQVSTLTRQDLTGKGTVEFHEGHYHFPATALARLKKAKTLAYFRKKFPDFESQGFAFERFRLSGEAKGGFLTIGDSLVEAQDVRAALIGRVELEKNGLDFYSRLQLREKSPALKRLIPGRYVYGSAGRETIQPIYGRLQGTSSEWAIKATTSSKIPAGIQKSLKKSITSR